MTTKSIFWQTILLLMPAALLLLWGTPIVVIEIWKIFQYGGLGAVTEDGWLGVLRIGAGLLAILEVVRLARKTIKSEKYSVGFPFVLATLFGGIAVSYVERLFGFAFAAIIAAPAVVLVVNLLRTQNEI